MLDTNALGDGCFEFFRTGLSSASEDQLFEAIVNLPFQSLMSVEIDLGIVVLLLVNPKTNKIDRVALSKTEQAEGAVRMSAKKFHDIKIPVSHPKNIISKAVETQKLQDTRDWYYLFTPALSATEARFNQLGSGIEHSYVSPFNSRDGGALIFSFNKLPMDVSKPHETFIKEYTKLVADRLAIKQP